METEEFLERFESEFSKFAEKQIEKIELETFPDVSDYTTNLISKWENLTTEICIEKNIDPNYLITSYGKTSILTFGASQFFQMQAIDVYKKCSEMVFKAIQDKYID